MPETTPNTDAEHNRALRRRHWARARASRAVYVLAFVLGVLAIIVSLMVAEESDDLLHELMTLAPLLIFGILMLYLAAGAYHLYWRERAIVRLVRFALDRGFRLDLRPDANDLATIRTLRLLQVGSGHRCSDVVRGRALGRRIWAIRLLAEYPLPAARQNPRTGARLSVVRETVSVVVIDGLTVRPPAFRLLAKGLKPTAARALRDGDELVEGFPDLDGGFTFVSGEPEFLREWLPTELASACRCEPAFSVEACGDLLAVFARSGEHDPRLIERLLEHALWLADLFEGKRDGERA